MRRGMWVAVAAAVVVVLACLAGRAAGSAAASAAVPVSSETGDGTPGWAYAVVVFAGVLVVRYVWRRGRRRG